MAVTVAFDAGTSGTKVIANYQASEYPFDQTQKYFLVDPSVRPLTQQTYQNLLDYAADGVGLGSNLVSYLDPKSGNRVYWEVGETASRPGLLAVRDRKFEKLLAKVLSFLGYLVHCEMQATELLKFRLGVLLPFDEIEDRRLLAQWLRQVLGAPEDESPPGFEFNGVAIANIRLETIECKPEGYGIYKAYPGERVAVLIIGHSDSSWLYFNNGMLNAKLSQTLPETGMHDFLQTLSFPITYELRAAQLLTQAGTALKSSILAELTQTKSDAEVQHLQQAIREAKAQYWVDRRSQFSSLNVPDARLVTVSGGAANYFSSELNQLFKELFGVHLHWCKSLMLEFFERFGIERKSDLLHRFADCYGYYRTLPGVEPYQVKPVEVVGAKDA
ncbi:hypothetical protein [Chroococcidiopsis sp. CCMEE 29]|uniref:ParM/StbA family protein n=1 Tax=Chroococcidiopsis sp. CCMEE 29 TaxID=155894 RepID=UPI0020208A2E|nr:hypothetical protein [Chroococcidiopsis sp. CCMEE 29]